MFDEIIKYGKAEINIYYILLFILVGIFIGGYNIHLNDYFSIIAYICMFYYIFTENFSYQSIILSVVYFAFITQGISIGMSVSVIKNHIKECHK